MKKLMKFFVSMVAVMLLQTSCIFATNTATVSETRKVSGFSEIEANSVATIYFTQSDTYSFTIEGPKEFIENTTTIVKGNRLVIGHKKKMNNVKKGAVIHISAPHLTKVEFDGVGSFNCKESLNLQDISLEMDGVGQLNITDLHCRNANVNIDGVGSVKIHLDCDYLDASIDGVGSVEFSGKAKKANIERDGIGSVKTKDLMINE